MVAHQALQLNGNLVENPPMSLEEGQRMGQRRADIQGLRARRRAARRRLPRRAARCRAASSASTSSSSISGFVITGTLLRRADGHRPDRPAALLRARACSRLLPALALMVTAVAVLAHARCARWRRSAPVRRPGSPRRCSPRTSTSTSSRRRLLRRRRDARPAPAHVDARRRGAVLPRLPGRC